VGATARQRTRREPRARRSRQRSGSSTSGAMVHRGAAVETRARWSASAARTSGPWRAPAARQRHRDEAADTARMSGRWKPPAQRQPNLGRGGSTRARRNPRQGSAPAARQTRRGAHLGPDGTHQRREPRARRQTRREPRARRESWRGSAPAQRQPKLGAVEATRARQPGRGANLGPWWGASSAPSAAQRQPSAARTLGAAKGASGTAAEPRARGGYQGAVEAPGHGSRRSGPWWLPGRSGAARARQPSPGP